MFSFFKKKANPLVGKRVFEIKNQEYFRNIDTGKFVHLKWVYVDGEFNPILAYNIGMQKIISVT